MEIYYKILELPKNFTLAQLKKSYSEKSFRFHPDRGGDEEKFKLIQKAYDFLLSKVSGKVTTTKIIVNKSWIRDASPPEVDLWGQKMGNSEKQDWSKDLKTPIDKLYESKPKSYFKNSFNYLNDEMPDVRNDKK